MTDTIKVLVRFKLVLAVLGLSACPLVADGEPIRVACVGDSITYGHGLAERDRTSYPAQLSKQLGDTYDVRNFGRSGASVLKQSNRPYWTQPEYAAAKQFAPHLVVLMLGTNDTQALNWKPHHGEFAADFAALLKSFHELESRPTIIVCLPPPLFRDRGKEWDTDAVLHEEILPQITQAAGDDKLPIVDMYAAFANRSDLMPDGVHPNAAGAELIAEQVAKAIKTLPEDARATRPTSSRELQPQ